MKGALQLRPVYHYREDRIRAHVQLCWLALLLTRVIETAASDSWRNIRHQLDRIHLATLATTGRPPSVRSPLPPSRRSSARSSCPNRRGSSTSSSRPALQAAEACSNTPDQPCPLSAQVKGQFSLIVCLLSAEARNPLRGKSTLATACAGSRLTWISPAGSSP
jgi:hypothetical protein